MVWACCQAWSQNQRFQSYFVILQDQGKDKKPLSIMQQSLSFVEEFFHTQHFSSPFNLTPNIVEYHDMKAYYPFNTFHRYLNIFGQHRLWDEFLCLQYHLSSRCNLMFWCILTRTNKLLVFHLRWWPSCKFWYQIFDHYTAEYL